MEERLVSEERGEAEGAEQRGKKCSAEGGAGSKDSPVDKRPRLEESDVVVPFVVQPKIKDTPISSDAFAMKNPTVALSLAASVSLPADKATFREEPDLVAIAFVAQSALLTVGRIAELGCRQRDAIERIGRLEFEAEGERRRAKFEAMRATMECARVEAENERVRTADQLKSEAEDRANASEESLKLAQEALSKAEAELEELKAAKEKAESVASTALEAGKSAALKEYVDEVPKFENRGFKHGWFKALAAAGVTLALPIPYEAVDGFAFHYFG
ncbi:uncharacterized protein LOC114302039 [Camellia sinensis]|uniref:uncharacterized protein LOC114302039 n=1 Tax=Camellia sinensis TaxID=4442 RepID=UPI001035F5DF|nr:uncharacterized protein LOC114302039 [Camellia sinensis]